MQEANRHTGLVITRKEQQAAALATSDGIIEVRVIGIKGKQVRIHFSSPSRVRIRRDEKEGDPKMESEFKELQAERTKALDNLIYALAHCDEISWKRGEPEPFLLLSARALLENLGAIKPAVEPQCSHPMSYMLNQGMHVAQVCGRCGRVIG